MSRRWLVETTSGAFDDVGANHVEVESGCLIFREYTYDEPTVIIAAGRWISAVREAAS